MKIIYGILRFVGCLLCLSLPFIFSLGLRFIVEVNGWDIWKDKDGISLVTLIVVICGFGAGAFTTTFAINALIFKEYSWFYRYFVD